MTENSTPSDAELRSRLSATAVGDWKAGWDLLRPALEAGVRRDRPLFAGRIRTMAAAALLAAALLMCIWWVRSMRPGGTPAVPPSLPVKLATDAPREAVAAPRSAAATPSSSRDREGSFGASRAGRRTLSPAAGKDTLAGGQHPSDEPPQGQVADLPILASARLMASPGAVSAREDAVPPISLSPDDTPLVQAAASRPAGFSRGFSFSVGLQVNGTSSFGDAASNYSPVLKGSPVDLYPVVSVSRQLGKRLSLGVDIALFSPVSVRRKGLSKSVSYPDRAAVDPDISESEDYLSVSRLYYAEMPVVVSYRLGKRFYAGSGLELSVLQKIIGEKQRQDYDAQGMMTFAMPESPRPRDLTHAKSLSGTVRPVEIRWVAELRYRLGNRWEASLHYQHGLSTISKDKTFLNGPSTRNDVVAAGMHFVIR